MPIDLYFDEIECYVNSFDTNEYLEINLKAAPALVLLAINFTSNIKI